MHENSKLYRYTKKIISEFSMITEVKVNVKNQLYISVTMSKQKIKKLSAVVYNDIKTLKYLVMNKKLYKIYSQETVNKLRGITCSYIGRFIFSPSNHLGLIQSH